MAAISKNGGMSMTNGYDVQFDFSGLTDLNTVLQGFNINLNSSNETGQPGSLINLFCDEAQLPNLQYATGQINGKHLGIGSINYPHTRITGDFGLTWMCDANMTPYKFLISWYNFIRNDTTFNEGSDASKLRNFKSYANSRAENRINRMRFPDEYQAVLRIAKTERGANAPNSRVPLVMAMNGVFPYAIDAVPLSYGTSQITRVSASFYYTNVSSYFGDIRKNRG